MKTKMFFYCFLSLIVIKINAQWIAQPKVNNQSFYGSFFTSPTTGFAVGTGTNSIWKTIDGGTSWIPVNTGDFVLNASLFNSIYFANANIGYAVGINGHTGNGGIIKTTDGGVTWSLINLNTSAAQFTDVYFSSTTTGYVTGSNGSIYITTDGGNSWTYSMPTSKVLMSIYFVNANIGYCVGDGIILKTTNFGLNWTKLYDGLDPDFDLFGVDFKDPLTGYIVSPTHVFKTIDGGSTWSALNCVNGGSDLKVFNDTVYVSGGNTIYKTIDAGVHWGEQKYNTSFGSFHEMFFYNNNNGWILGSQTVLKTSNGGGICGPAPNSYLSFVCQGDTIGFTNMNNPNYSYQWFLNNTLVANTYHLSLICNTPGNNNLKIVSFNGSVYDTSYVFSFNVNPLPVINPFIITSDKDTVCPLENYTLSVSNTEWGVPYQLFLGPYVNIGAPILGNGGTLLFNGTPISSTSTFNIKAVKHNTCDSAVSRIYKTIVVSPHPNSNVSVLIANSPLCEGDSTTIQIVNSQVGVLYQFYKGLQAIGAPIAGNGASVSFNTGPLNLTTTYDIKVKTIFGCEIYLATHPTVVVNAITKAFTIQTDYFVGDTILISNSSTLGYHYLWSFDIGASPLFDSVYSPSVSYSSSGSKIVKLIITTANGCIDSISQVISVWNHNVIGSGNFCYNDTFSNIGIHQKKALYYYDYCADSMGYSYACGYRMDQSNFYNSAIRKFDENGNLLWEKFSEPIGNFDYHSSFSTSITSDNKGKIYVGGNFASKKFCLGPYFSGSCGTVLNNANNSNTQGFVAKLDPAGTEEWIIHMYHNTNSSGFAFVGVADILYVNDEQIFLSVSSYDSFDIKFVNGNVISFNNADRLKIIQIDKNGNYKKTIGSFEMIGMFGGMYSEISPDAGVNYKKMAVVSPKIKMDSQGKIYVVGSFENSAISFTGSSLPNLITISSGCNNFFAIIDTVTGWDKAFISHALNYNLYAGDQRRIPVFDLDNNDNIYTSSYWSPYNNGIWIDTMRLGNGQILSGEQNSFLAKYDKNGNLIWCNTNNFLFDQSIQCSRQYSNVYFYGSYKNVLGLNSQNTTNLGVRSKGDRDIFLNCFDQNGNNIWLRNIGTVNMERSYLMRKIPCSDNLLMLGKTYGNSSIISDGYVINTNSSKDFILKFSPLNNCSDPFCKSNVIGIEDIKSEKDLVKIIPNPNSGVFVIQSPVQGTYSIINELGQTMQQFQLNSSNNYTMNIENLDSGIYFIVGYNNNQMIKQKIVVAK